MPCGKKRRGPRKIIITALVAVFLYPAFLFAQGSNLSISKEGETVKGYVTMMGCDTGSAVVPLQCNATGYPAAASDGVEDAAETAAGTLTMMGSVRRDTAASSAGTTGDNATINTDAKGKLWTSGASKINVAAAGDDTDTILLMGLMRDANVSQTWVTSESYYGRALADDYGAQWVRPIKRGVTLTDTAVIQAAAYASGDCIMAAAEQFTGTVVNSPFLTGRLTDIIITDLAGQAADIDVVIFSADPGNICAAINAAADIDDDDLAKVMGVIPVRTHYAFNDNSISVVTNINVKYTSTGASALWYGLISRGTPTYGGTSDLAIAAKVEWD